MKVSFNPTSLPIKNVFLHNNFPVSSQKNNNLSCGQDVFIKSEPVFKGLPEGIIRSDVVENGVNGIVSVLTLYLNPCTSACGHRMPLQEDFDYCMKLFFPLSCAASSSYAVKGGGHVEYPNEDEFVEILQTLWMQSEGLRGADMEKYLDPEVVKQRESERMSCMYDFIKEDIGRAMSVYSQNRFDKPIRNLDDVREFALKIYDDDSIRTICPWISAINNDMARKGRLSKWAKELANQGSSGAMLHHLLTNQDKFFSNPRSIRCRFEQSHGLYRKDPSYERYGDKMDLIDEIFYNELGI